MDEKRNARGGEGAAGLIYKSAQLEKSEITEEQLKAINKYTLAPLAAEDLFTFSAVLCDNDIDRQYEQFTVKALEDLRKLFKGKPVIKDHFASANNQVARIYDTELVDTGKKLASGEPYMQLKAHIYMVRTDSNRDLITEIMAGIKKEGSVGCAVTSAVCSVCGTDNAKSYCAHYPGRNYGGVLCTFKLEGAKDAYEFSLVAIPAQRKAGVSKSYTGQQVFAPDEVPEEKANKEKARTLALRARLLKI